MKLEKSKSKKYKDKLPEDFQEVLMSTEMELEEGLTVPVLRKLVYLYTRGMQYYDLEHKEKFRKFYNEKLVSLLTRKDVVQFLEENKIDFEDKKDLDKIFSSPSPKRHLTPTKKSPMSKTENVSDIDNNLEKYFKNFSNFVRRNSKPLSKKPMNLQEIQLFIKHKILEVSTNLNKIDKAMTNEVIEQMTEFETRKRQMKIRKKKEVIENNSNSNSEDENEKILTPEEELKILELSGLTKKDVKDNNDEKEEKKVPVLRNTIGNNPMLREIEEYVQKNMNEMYQAFDELKASFQDEIKEAEENGFDDIAQGLKDDLQSELDNLKDQYEEQRRVETEKIKAKYSKRNSLLVS